jgi:hypothetical protein
MGTDRVELGFRQIAHPGIFRQSSDEGAQDTLPLDVAASMPEDGNDAEEDEDGDSTAHTQRYLRLGAALSSTCSGGFNGLHRHVTVVGSYPFAPSASTLLKRPKDTGEGWLRRDGLGATSLESRSCRKLNSNSGKPL